MRQLMLTEKDIERIQFALKCLIHKNREFVNSSDCVLEFKHRQEVIKENSKYESLFCDINEKKLDV